MNRKGKRKRTRWCEGLSKGVKEGPWKVWEGQEMSVLLSCKRKCGPAASLLHKLWFIQWFVPRFTALTPISTARAVKRGKEGQVMEERSCMKGGRQRKGSKRKKRKRNSSVLHQTCTT